MSTRQKNKNSYCFHSPILVFLAVLLFFSSATTIFAAEQCSGVTDANNKCYESYDAYFQADPKAAAIQYPDKYMTFITEHPNAITSNPDAYEVVISENIAYLNQNKGAFQTFAATKGVQLDVVEAKATFGSYDSATGRMETVGADGTTVISIDFETLKQLDANGVIGFLDYGQLLYAKDKNLENIYFMKGELKAAESGVEIKKGKIYLSDAGQSLELTGENTAIVQGDHVIVYASTPIQIQYKEESNGAVGTLVRGSAELSNRMNEGSFMLLDNSEFITFHGTNIQTKNQDYIKIAYDKEHCTVSCIFEKTDSLYVNTGGISGDVAITTPDSAEKKILVSSFSSFNKGNLHLTLQKADGAAVVLGFSKDPPTIQGNMDGLQTKIAHTFTYEDKVYPWILSNGETINSVGTTNTNPLIELIKEKKIDANELSFLIESMDNYDFREIITDLDDPTLQYQLLNTYRATTNNQLIMTDEETMIISSIENKEVRVELMTKLLKNTVSFENERAITDALYRFEESPEIVDLIIDKSGSYDADTVLLGVSSPDIQKKIITNAESFDSVASLDRVTDKELKLEIAKKMDFTSGDFADFETPTEPNIRKGIAYRTVLEAFSDDPEALQTVLKEMPDNEEFDFYPQQIAEIYADPTFQEQTNGMDFANRYSVAITTDRLMRRSGEENPSTTEEAVTAIMAERKKFENYHILDEDTYYIPITHEEDRFENDDMVRLARDSGVTEVADPNLKGSLNIDETKAVKAKFLTYVSESNEKGKTTIHFNNHGGPEHQWLSFGQAGSEVSDEMHNPQAISYVELGDSLLERGKLDDVTIMIDSCYSNDFKNNLYSYLNEKGSTTLPVIITETNRGQVGWGGVFDSALSQAHTPGQPLTGADMFKVESKTFESQDLSVTIPATDSSTLKWTDATVGPVLDLGSTNDAGASLAPTKPDTTETQKQTTSQPSPTNVLEIATNEQAAEEEIGFA